MIAIYRGYGTGVAGVALATPRFLNLIYNFFWKSTFSKSALLWATPRWNPFRSPWIWLIHKWIPSNVVTFLYISSYSQVSDFVHTYEWKLKQDLSKEEEETSFSYQRNIVTEAQCLFLVQYHASITLFLELLRLLI